MFVICFSVGFFLSGEGHLLPKAPLSQRMHTSTGTKHPPTMAPMVPPMLPPGGVAGGGESGGGGGEGGALGGPMHVIRKLRAGVVAATSTQSPSDAVGGVAKSDGMAGSSNQ